MDNDRPLAERVARLEAALAQLTARYERGATEPADPPGTQCGEPSPYTGDKCQEIKGHTHAHHAGLLDAWGRTPPRSEPYNMAEPLNPGAIVTSNGCLYYRRVILAADGKPWQEGNLIPLLAWDEIDDPQPFQNCVLTADDPEPPGGSVVRYDDDSVWQSETGGDWRSMDDVNAYEWTRLLSDRHPVTLLYRGEA